LANDLERGAVMKKSETFVEGLCKILVKRKTIKEKEADALKKAFRESAKPNFDEFLLDEGLVDKDDLLPALGEYYQVPSFDAIGYFFDHQLVRMFPKEFLTSNAIIPVEQDENILVMLANNPADPNLLSRIGKYVSYDIQFRVGLLQDIYDSIREFYDESLAVTNEDIDKDFDETALEREKEIEQQEDIEELAIKDIESEE
jgi:hypothetical protein